MGVSSNIKRYVAILNGDTGHNDAPAVPSNVRRYCDWLIAGSVGAAPHVGSNVKRYLVANVDVGGGIALVQSASGTTADGSAGLTVNFGVPVTAGNSVIALLSWDGGGLSVNPAIVGGGGGAMAEQVGESPSFRIRICSLHNVASGVTGVTYTSAAVRASMQILEVSGLADAAATDTGTNSGNNDIAILSGLAGEGVGVVVFAVASTDDPFDLASLTAGWTGVVTGGNGVWQLSAFKVGTIDGTDVTVGLVDSGFATALPYAVAGVVFAAA